MKITIRNAPAYISRADQVALDFMEEAFGFRLEKHQLLAMGVTLEWKKHTPGNAFTMPTQRDLRESDRVGWLEVLRMAYAGTKARRKSRAQRRGKACAFAIYRRAAYYAPRGTPPVLLGTCRREIGHEGEHYR